MRKSALWLTRLSASSRLLLCGVVAGMFAVPAAAQQPAPGNAAPATQAPPDATPPANTPPANTPPTGAIPPQGTPNAGPPADPSLPVIPPEQIKIVREKGPDQSVIVEKHVYDDPKGGEVLHGSWKQFDPSGKVIASGEFVHGKRHGHWTKWVGAGQSELYANPAYGGYPGPWFTEATFNYGVLHGPWIVLDARKQKMSEWHFENGTQHGPWIWYYPSGKKMRESVYNAGVLDGPTVEYGPGGEVTSTEEYVGGRRKYSRVWWYGPGQKRIEGWYLAPAEKTKTTYDWWNSAGQTVVIGREGKPALHGKWTWWHPGGQKSVEGFYHIGEQIGRWTWFTPDGKISSEKDFVVAGVTPPGQAPADGATPPNGAPAGTPPGVTADQPPAAKATPPASTQPPATGNTPPAGTPPASSPPASSPPSATPPKAAPAAGEAAPGSSAPSPAIKPDATAAVPPDPFAS